MGRNRRQIWLLFVCLVGASCRDSNADAGHEERVAHERTSLIVQDPLDGSGLAPETRNLSRTPIPITEGTGTSSAASDVQAIVPEVEVAPAPEWPPYGLEAIEVDLAAATLDEASGRLVQTTEEGYRIVFTIDPDLQDHLLNVVSRYPEPAEAVVAIEPGTGRVLALVQDTGEDAPVDDPAFSPHPYAASVFKIITGSALLDAGVDPDETVCVSAARRSLEIADLEPSSRRDDLCVTMVGAMARSANTYFARMADQHLSQDDLDEWIDRFGFNREIPLEVLTTPSPAEVPDDRLERARMSAGFRHSHLSPLHAAVFMAAIANGGTAMTPAMVLEVQDGEGTVIYTHSPTIWFELMSESLAAQLTHVLSETTRTGTARRWFAQRDGWPASLVVAGKTGTLSNRSDEDPSPDPLLTFSWFVGFAPIDSPSVAVAAVVYNPERWHIKGGYLASEAVIEHHRNTQ